MGCDLEKHGNVCMHLNYFVLKGGNIGPYVEMTYMSIEKYQSQTEPNEPKEESFRQLLEPFVSDLAGNIPNHITSFQLDILVLRYVYSMSYRKIATELGGDHKTIRTYYRAAIQTLKPLLESIKNEIS